MLYLKNCLRLLHTERLIYNQVDYESSDSFKKLAEASDKAMDADYWKKNGDPAEVLGKRCETALSDYQAKTKVEKTKLDTDKITKIQNLMSTLPAEPDKNDKKKAKEWTEWKTKSDAVQASVKAVETDTAEKQGTLDKEFEAAKTRMTTLRDATVRQVGAAVAAREKAKEKISEQIKKSLEAGVDPEDRKDFEEAADIAEDIADDDIVGAGMVNDYLNSELNGVKLNEDKIENMTMGICARLHEKGNKKDDSKDKTFMRALETREDKGGGTLNFVDDGIEASDLRYQVLESMGVAVKDRDSRQEALEGAPAKLVSDIMTNEEIAPQLRGMLLGHMIDRAKSGGKSPEDAAKEVQQMYDVLLQAKKEGKLPIDADPSTSGAGGFWNTATGFAEVYNQEASLQKCAAAFLTLQDVVGVQKYQEALAKYEQFKAVTGKTDPGIEAVVGEAKSPVKMRKSAATVEALIPLAVAQYRANEVMALTTSPEYKSAVELATFYGTPAPFEAGLKSLVDKEQPLTGFMAQEAELKQQIATVDSDPAMRKAAAERQVALNSKIQRVNEYKEAKGKQKGKKAEGLPVIAADYKPLESGAPSDVKKAVETYATIEDDYTKAQAGFSQIGKAPAAVGGGGGGSGAGSTEYVARPAAPKKVEVGSTDVAVLRQRYKDLPPGVQAAIGSENVYVEVGYDPDKIGQRVTSRVGNLGDDGRKKVQGGEFMTDAGVQISVNDKGEAKVTGYTTEAKKKAKEAQDKVAKLPTVDDKRKAA